MCDFPRTHTNYSTCTNGRWTLSSFALLCTLGQEEQLHACVYTSDSSTEVTFRVPATLYVRDQLLLRHQDFVWWLMTSCMIMHLGVVCIHPIMPPTQKLTIRSTLDNCLANRIKQNPSFGHICIQSCFKNYIKSQRDAT